MTQLYHALYLLQRKIYLLRQPEEEGSCDMVFKRERRGV
jgi:hypothetical protein